MCDADAFVLQGKAQEKLEAKSVSFLKLLADVLGVAHGEDGKKKTLVDDLVAFLAAPRKVRRGVNLADKAEALKEQRRVAKEKKEKKAKRVRTHTTRDTRDTTRHTRHPLTRHTPHTTTGEHGWQGQDEEQEEGRDEEEAEGEGERLLFGH